MLQYSDDHWRAVKGVPRDVDMQSISAVDENDVWFAGIEGEIARNSPELQFWILHYDGKKINKVGSWAVDKNVATIAMAARTTAGRHARPDCCSTTMEVSGTQHRESAKNG